MMDSEKKSVLKQVHYFLSLSAGSELDRWVAIVVLGQKVEECAEAKTGYHFARATHYESKLQHMVLCPSYLPAFSTDWGDSRAVFEWLIGHYDGVELYWDSEHWGVNINTRDNKGRWFRLTSTAGTRSMSEAVCKAALLVKINPQMLALQIRSTADINLSQNPKKRKRRKKT